MKRSSTKRNALVGITTLFLVLVCGASLARADDPVPPADDEPSTPEQPPAPTEPAPEPLPEPEADAPPPEKKKTPFNLYVSVGVGDASADEFNMSITRDTALSEASLEIDEIKLGFASVGWQFPEGKGDLRLTFRGHKENSYGFHAVGKQPQTNSIGNVNLNCVEAGGGTDFAPCLIPWWSVDVSDGHLHSVRTPSTWSSANDANGNGFIDISEVQFLAPDRIIDLPVADNLQNQLVTYDMMYGREFGPRRVSSRWWAGIRYFQYQGNLLAGAWLVPPLWSGGPGEGFTEGQTLRLLNMSQDSSGFGPTGSWEVDVNFFNKGLVLYGRAQSALTFSQLETDSGPFYTVIEANDANNQLTMLYLPANLSESRDKSSWHNTIEAGARVRMKNGLEFELAYGVTGFLDVVLTPSSITVPGGVQQSTDGVSGLFATQDYKISGWHATVGFQF